MKIFFLYHERWAKDQAEPILRVSKELGITCFPCPSNPGIPELLWPDYDDSKRRIELEEITKKVEKLKPDIILVHTRSLSNYLLQTQIPLILIEHTDGTALELSRHLIELPQVLSVVKGSVFTNYEFYNSPLCEGMYHGKYMNFFNLPKKAPYKKLPKKTLEKIILGYSFGAFPNNKRFINYDIKKQRNLDISFIGTTNYPRSKLVTQHRKLASQKIINIKNSIFKEGTNQVEYDQIMNSSKICISPYGYGVCFRSFESIYCGCLTIQPYCDFMKTWPNIFIDKKTYFKCESDFSDLNNVVKYMLENYKDLIESVYEKREELIDCFFNNKTLCDYVQKNIIIKSQAIVKSF